MDNKRNTMGIYRMDSSGGCRMSTCEHSTEKKKKGRKFLE